MPSYRPTNNAIKCHEPEGKKEVIEIIPEINNMADPITIAESLYSAYKVIKAIRNECNNAKNCSSFLGCVDTKLDLIANIMMEIQNHDEALEPHQTNNTLR